MNRFCSTTVLSDNITVRVSTNSSKMIGRIKKAKEKYSEQVRVMIEEQPEEIWTADFPLDWLGICLPQLLSETERERRRQHMKGMARRRWDKRGR